MPRVSLHESDVEEAALSWFGSLGYEVRHGPKIAPGDPKRIKVIARDLVEHFERRLEAMDGKAMVVCMSRRICVDLYNAIVELCPGWHNEDDEKGSIKIVMTGIACRSNSVSQKCDATPQTRKAMVVRSIASMLSAERQSNCPMALGGPNSLRSAWSLSAPFEMVWSTWNAGTTS